jgi:hypothetical protein
MQSTATNKEAELYEVNLYVELEYPDIEDINGNEGSGRYQRDLPDWNIIFLTELDQSASLDQILDDAKRRFPKEMLDFLNEHKNALRAGQISLENHEYAQDGIHFPEADEIIFEENNCAWESHWDEWEDEDEDEDEE